MARCVQTLHRTDLAAAAENKPGKCPGYRKHCGHRVGSLRVFGSCYWVPPREGMTNEIRPEEGIQATEAEGGGTTDRTHARALGQGKPARSWRGGFRIVSGPKPNEADSGVC